MITCNDALLRGRKLGESLGIFPIEDFFAICRLVFWNSERPMPFTKGMILLLEFATHQSKLWVIDIV